MKRVFQEYRSSSRQCVDESAEQYLNFKVGLLCVSVCVSVSHSPLHHQHGTLPSILIKVIIVIHLIRIIIITDHPHSNCSSKSLGQPIYLQILRRNAVFKSLIENSRSCSTRTLSDSLQVLSKLLQIYEHSKIKHLFID